MYPACRSQDKAPVIDKQIGHTFHFHCTPTLCDGQTFNYTHYDQITGEPLQVHQGSTYTKRISSLEDGGDYCCVDQCAGSKNMTSTVPECCITVTSKAINNFVITIIHTDFVCYL